MQYKKFCSILNSNIFEKSKSKLLTAISERPERYIGLFRATKPKTKIIQNLLQSQEIKFGDSFEEIIREYILEMGYKNQGRKISKTCYDLCEDVIKRLSNK